MLSVVMLVLVVGVGCIWLSAMFSGVAKTVRLRRENAKARVTRARAMASFPESVLAPPLSTLPASAEPTPKGVVDSEEGRDLGRPGDCLTAAPSLGVIAAQQQQQQEQRQTVSRLPERVPLETRIPTRVQGSESASHGEMKRSVVNGPSRSDHDDLTAGFTGELSYVNPLRAATRRSHTPSNSSQAP